MINIKQIAAATALASGLGLAGVGAASVAEAMPMAPMPDYHWCPGQWFDPAWGNNWDWNRCHDDFYGDGDPHDQAHWHGQGNWHPDGDDWNHNGPGWQPNGGPGPGPVGPNGMPNGGPGPGPWAPNGPGGPGGWNGGH